MLSFVIQSANNAHGADKDFRACGREVFSLVIFIIEFNLRRDELLSC